MPLVLVFNAIVVGRRDTECRPRLITHTPMEESASRSSESVDAFQPLNITESRPAETREMINDLSQFV